MATSGAAITDVLTPEWLNKRYNFGIDLTNDDGESYPRELLEHSIAAAAEQVGIEIGTNIKCLQSFTGERHDVLSDEGDAFYLQQLDERPVRSVERIAVRYGDFEPTNLPVSWVHIRGPNSGQVQIIPGEQAFSGLFFTNSNLIFPTALMASRRYTAAWFEWDYTAGIDWDDPAQADELILRAVGLNAAMLVLDTAGDLIVGAGIASKSVSFDGLSTNINTTSSATNAGYGARILSYGKQLERVIKALRAKYKVPQWGVF